MNQDDYNQMNRDQMAEAFGEWLLEKDCTSMPDGWLKEAGVEPISWKEACQRKLNWLKDKFGGVMSCTQGMDVS